MPTFAATIAGTTRKIRNVAIAQVLNARGTLSCDAISADASWRPAFGAEILVTEDGTRIFGGTINVPAEAGFGGSGASSAIVTRISAVDFNEIPERRFVNLTLASGTLKSMLTTLVSTYLSAYGISLHPSQADGPTVAELPVSYKRLSDLLNDLTTITGWVWRINYDKQLRMIDPASIAAPFNISESDQNTHGDIEVEPIDTQDYANRITVRYQWAGQRAYAFFALEGGNAADGETVVIGSRTYTFQTTLTDVNGNVLIGATPTDSINNLYVAINGLAGAGSVYAASTDPNSQVTAVPLGTGMKVLAQTVGAAGNSIGVSETSTNGRWFGEGNQALSTLHLGADEALSNTVTVENASEISARGIYEKVFDHADVYTADVATALANGYLSRYGSIRRTVTYVTRQTGLAVGMVQTITAAKRNMGGAGVACLITELQTVDIVPGFATWRVTATEGPALGTTWRDYFKQIASGGGGGGSSTVVVGGGGGTSGGIGGSGTIGKLAKWLTTTSLTDSKLSESTTSLTMTMIGALIYARSGVTQHARLQRLSDHQVGLSQNLVFDGANFLLDDTTKSGWFMRLTGSGGATLPDTFQVVQASAGSNPRTLNTVLHMTNAAAMGVGTQVGLSSGSITIQNNCALRGVNAAGSGSIGLIGLDTNDDIAMNLNSGPLVLANAVLAGSAGAVSQWWTVTVNGTSYKIPLHAV